MKNIIPYIGFLLYAITLPSCTGSPAVKSDAGFDKVMGRDWLLEEFRSGSVTVRIDRKKADGIDIYSVRFDAERLSGIGAPNRCFTSYTAGNDNTLSIGMTASTRMSPVFENENFREYDYFGYLEKVSRWNLHNGKLELHTSGENGEAVLIFR
ncbi:MAG: META domain-containing protein [Treponema sp.]|nr:META domain-containing protein [Treponema sp.]